MTLEFHQLDLRYEPLKVRRPRRERRLLASLAEHGQQVPIVVVSLSGEANRYRVIDGFKRIRALKRLARDTVLTTVWYLGEAEALLLSRSLHTREAETALEQGWLLAELSERFALSPEELAQRFERSPSWVSRRLALVRELPVGVQERVRQGQIAAHAAMRSLVPLARANRKHCERLAKAIAPLSLSSRDVEELVRAFRRGNQRLRSRLLECPTLFLRSRQETRSDSPLDPAKELKQKVERLARLVQSLLPQQGLEAWQGLLDDERELLRRRLEQTFRDLDQLLQALPPTPSETASHKETLDAEPGTAHGDSPAPLPRSGETTDRPRPEDLSRNRPAGDSLGLPEASVPGATLPGCNPPAADPRAVCDLQRQPEPSVRGTGR